MAFEFVMCCLQPQDCVKDSVNRRTEPKSYLSNLRGSFTGLTDNLKPSKVKSKRNALFYRIENDQDEYHHSKLGLHAFLLWKHHKVTDITIKFQNKEYDAHKTVLSCYSTFFKERLLLADAPKDCIELDLPSITVDAFETLLYYMYAGHLELTCQNIGDVYTASRKLGIKTALLHCIDVFMGKSNPEVQAVYLYATAKKLKETATAQRSLTTMARHFEQIVGTNEFLDLTFDQVTEYLSCDELAIRSEVVVYLAALKWLSAKFLDREPCIEEVVKCVRFPNMTLSEVLACHSPPLLSGIVEIPAVQHILLEATCYVAAKSVNEQKRFAKYACKPRVYLIERVPLILWDPNIFDPVRYGQYKREMAATTIQAGFRGYMAREHVKQLKLTLNLNQDSYPQKTAAKNENQHFSNEYSESGYDSSTSGVTSGSPKSSAIDGYGSRISMSSSYRIQVPSKQSESGQKQASANATYAQNNEKTYLNGKTEKQKQAVKETGLNKIASGKFHVTDYAYTDRYLPDYEPSTPIRTGVLDDEYNSDMNLSPQQRKNLDDHALSKFPKVISNYKSNQKSGVGSESKASTNHVQNDNESGTRKFNNSGLYSDNLGNSSGIQDRERTNGIIVVLGGFDPNNQKNASVGETMISYNPALDEWSKFGKMPVNRHHICAVLLNGYIYIIGGCDFENTSEFAMIPSKTCFKLDINSQKWSQIASMNDCRIFHGAAVLRSKIYVAGGLDDENKILDSIECYVPEDNRWQYLPVSLSCPKMSIGVCAHRDQLWLAGGMIEDDTGKLSIVQEVECYDPLENKMKHNIALLPGPRCYLSLIECGEQVYSIGGGSFLSQKDDKISSLADVFIYDDVANLWVMSTPLPSPQHSVATVAFGGAIYALGGMTTYLPEVVNQEIFVYEPNRDVWSKCASLPSVRDALAAVTIPATS